MSMNLESTCATLTGELAYQFESTFSREEVAGIVARARADLEPTSRHPEFLPLLIERAARDELVSLARRRGAPAARMPEILFVCRHNEGRSQMAAALTHHLSEGAVHVRSAGVAPTGLLNPVVVDVLAERGIALDHAYPTPVRDDVLATPDVVVTMSPDLPSMAGRRELVWDIADPHHRSTEEVRAIREHIEQHVIDLLAELEVRLSPDAVRPAPAGRTPRRPRRTTAQPQPLRRPTAV